MNFSFADGRRALNHLLARVRFAVGMVTLAVAGSAFPAAPSTNQPNIIVLLADDLRWDAMGCAGNAVVRTPELDRLAAGGTRFSNAFVTTAICSVSSASVLTGQYARRHGVEDFRTPIADLGSTYPVLLQRAGYYTGFIGKWGVAAHGDTKTNFQKFAAAFDLTSGPATKGKPSTGTPATAIISATTALPSAPISSAPAAQAETTTAAASAARTPRSKTPSTPRPNSCPPKSVRSLRSAMSPSHSAFP